MVVLLINAVFLLWSLGKWDGVAAQCLQGASPDTQTTVPPATEDLRYLAPDQHLQSVIVPALHFNCHGYITSWSALTVIDSNPTFLQLLTYKITFTLWRPREDGSYDLVGVNDLTFETNELVSGSTPIDNSSGLVPERYAYFSFQNKCPIENRNLTFQPGDVIGWNIEKALGISSTITGPVLVVHRERTSQDQESVNLQYRSISNGTKMYCSVEHCDNFRMESSVVPYVSVHYVETSGDSSSGGDVISCVSRGEVCPATTAATLSSTSSPMTQCTGEECSNTPAMLYYIIGGAGGVVVILLVLILVFMCFCVVKVRRILKDDNFQDNPTYESADKVLDGDRCADFSIPMTETGIYATADAVQVRPAQPEMVECYASAYPSNGEAHLYQELPEGGAHSRAWPEGGAHSGTWSEGGGHARAWSVSVPREAVGPQIPVRATLSSTSRLNDGDFVRYHAPPPYSEVVKKPKVPEAPYLVSIPSTTSLASIGPRPRALTSVGSGPSLQSIPDEVTSPMRTTFDGGILMHKIFHATDDDFFRVPTADERMEFENMDSTDQVYSRLKFPNCKVSRGSVELENCDPYWQPSSSASELYDQLAKRKYREIHRDYITTTEYIGGGHFGKVHRGLQKVPGGDTPIAIKTLNPASSSADELKFLKEAAIMGQFLHPNVVKLLGVVTVGQPLMIVLELLPRGDLSHYLRKLRYQPSPAQGDLPHRLLQFCRQISFGMNYLANKGFVHRDLAARNILLAEDLTCKIGDFGMARDLEEDEVYISQGGKMPLKWTAPEAIKYHKFSSASDVWSYGMLLFEIWSLGMSPFEGTPVKRVLELVYTGYCQPPPPGCPRAIYQLMVACWHTVPEERIDFSNICTYLNSSPEPDEALLQWSTSDLNVFPQATKLGAPLTEAKKLYLDLQYAYSTV